MTQQSGLPGQVPQGVQQWPTQQTWNQPGQVWGAPQYGQPPAGSAAYPGAAAQQAPFGQVGYGQPGGFPPPGSPYPPRGPRQNPLRGLLFGFLLVVGFAFFAISMMDYLTADLEFSSPTVDQTTAPSSPDSAGVPAPDTNPPRLPQPTTYEEAEEWLVANPLYDQSANVPTDCAVPQIDITTASTAELGVHLNELTACLWRVWSDPLESSGYELPRPPVTVYSEGITTGCGNIEDVNAVYCSADQRIYYARSLWRIFPVDQQQDPFVVESILAHEFGHALQARTGILISSMALEQQASTSAARVYSRRLEVQADCFAGIFSTAVASSSGLSSRDLVGLREVFYNLGDDVLSNQANVQGDHGLGRSREAWFATGQENSQIGACNTYTAPASAVR